MALSKTLLALPVALVGLVAAQGYHVRRTALRLPNAAGPTGLHGSGGGKALHLVVIGDSVASGVGVDRHADTVAGRLADLLGEGRPVRRTVIAESGHAAADVTRLVTGRLTDADVVIVSVGVNDTKNLHSMRRWRHDLAELLDSVTAQAPEAPVVLLGLPPMELFPAMPRALGTALGARVRLMDRAAREIAARYPTVSRLDLPRSGFDELSSPFAHDGFHPSAELHEVFARRIHALLEVPHVR